MGSAAQRREGNGGLAVRGERGAHDTGAPLSRHNPRGRGLVLQRHFCVRTALLVTYSGDSATFVLPEAHPNPQLSL